MKKWKIDWLKLEGKIESKDDKQVSNQESNLTDKESEKDVLNIWVVKRTLKRG